MVMGRVPVFPFPSFQSRWRKSGWAARVFSPFSRIFRSPGEIPVAGSPAGAACLSSFRHGFRVRFPDGASQFGRHCKAAGGEICSLPAVPGWFKQRSREWSRIMSKWYVYYHSFPNGKKYIGITSQIPERRWGNQGRGYKNQGLIWNAILKFGWDNISHGILAEVDDIETAEYYEQYYITIYQADNRKYGYNIKSGGRAAKGHKLSPEVVKKMSESRKGENNWIYGKHLSEETKIKLSIAHKGKCDIEAIRKAAKERMGGKAYNARKVACFTRDGEYIKSFNSLADAGREYGIRPQDIYNCCNGRQLTTHGKRWKYAE